MAESNVQEGVVSEIELKARFHKAYSDEFVGDLIRLIINEYKTAHNECHALYPKEEAHDLRPYTRRAKIDSKIRELVKSYDEIEATPETNKTKTNHHTRIESSSVVMTVHAVANPKTLVRRAEHRKTYARSAQYNLFEPNLPPPPLDTALYINFIHGADKARPQFTAFMHIVFPSADLKKYLCRINLLDLPQFVSIVNDELTPVKPETIEDDLQLGFRLDALNKKKKESDDE
jgi:hypothetical protein